jgi:anti-sigma factor RsiW
MKKLPQSVDDTLLDYLDGRLSKSEVERVERELQQNPTWRSRLNELNVVTTSLSEISFEQPSKNFTQSVMTRLDQSPTSSGYSVRNGIWLLIGVLLAVGLASMLVSAGVFDNTMTSIDLNQVDFSKRFIKTPLPSFQFSGKVIVNAIIILNLGLGWLVLDRVILKPFFQRRIQTDR